MRLAGRPHPGTAGRIRLCSATGRDGKPCRSIANSSGICPNHIRAHQIDDATRAEVLRLHADGISYRRIKAIVGLTDRDVRVILENDGATTGATA